MSDKNYGSVGFCKNTITQKSYQLGGKIWISTTDNSISYQCVACKCEYASGELFEQHMPKSLVLQCRSEFQPHTHTQTGPQPQPQLQPQQEPASQRQVQPEPKPQLQPPVQQPKQQEGAAQIAVKQNELPDYRKQNHFQGTIDRRRFTIDYTNRQRFGFTANRSRFSIFANQRQQTHVKPLEQPNVSHRSVAPHRRPTKIEIDELINCKKCECKFKSLETLRDHNRRCHSYRCTLCDDTKNDGTTPKSFETEKGLWAHQRKHHSKQFPYKCDVCERAFVSRQQRNEHEETKHVRGNVYECDFCKRKLMSVFQKKNHIRKHHEDRRYHCQLCTGYKTKDSDNLKRHMKEKHPGQSDGRSSGT